MSLRYLLVDDNKDFLASATRLLDSQGADVVGCATSTAEALRLTDELRPDVALVDIELGREDGLEVAGRIRDRAPSTRIILISTYERDDLEELIAAGPATGFLAKSALGVVAIATLLR